MGKTAPRLSQTYRSLHHQQGWLYNSWDFCLIHWKGLSGTVAALAIFAIAFHFSQARSERQAKQASWAFAQAVALAAPATDPATPDAAAEDKQAAALATVVTDYPHTTAALYARFMLAQSALKHHDAPGLRKWLEAIPTASLTPLLTQSITEGIAASYELEEQWDRAALLYQHLYRDPATFDRVSALQNAARVLRRAGKTDELATLLAESPVVGTQDESAEALTHARELELLWHTVSTHL